MLSLHSACICLCLFFVSYTAECVMHANMQTVNFLCQYSFGFSLCSNLTLGLNYDLLTLGSHSFSCSTLEKLWTGLKVNQ